MVYKNSNNCNQSSSHIDTQQFKSFKSRVSRNCRKTTLPFTEKPKRTMHRRKKKWNNIYNENCLLRQSQWERTKQSKEATTTKKIENPKPKQTNENAKYKFNSKSDFSYCYWPALENANNFTPNPEVECTLIFASGFSAIAFSF